jgi:glycosyltransferase involved in cell wall biosynthesis
MRILLLGILTPGTGNSTTLTRIETELRAAGHDPHLCDAQELTNDQALNDIVQKQHIDAVIGLHALHAGRFARTLTVPLILIFGGTDVYEYSKIPSDLKIMTEAVSVAAAVVCFDTDSQKRVLGIWPEAQTKCEVIPQGVQVSTHTPWSLKDALDLPDGALIFLLPAGLRAEKAPGWLVEMFEEWHQTDPRIYQVVIGQERHKQYAETFRADLKTKTATLYHPAIPQARLHAAMAEATAVLNTSEHEIMPNSLLEALAIGTPVVARDIPGNRSIVQDGETGLLYASPIECRTKLERLLDQAELPQRFIENGKKLIAEHHSTEQESAHYDTLLRSLLHA